MENILIKVKSDKQKLFIEFKTNSTNAYYITTTKNELKTKYGVEHYQLNYDILKAIAKERRIKRIEQVLSFDSVVRILQNKLYKFQIEGSLVLISNLKTGEELFTDTKVIKNYLSFKESDFLKLKEDKQKITPAFHNIKTNEEQNEEDFTFDI